MTLLVSGPDDATPKAGTELPNGATVLEATNRLILACTRQGEYVTWKWDGKDLRSTWAGHYFTSLVEAANSFASR